MSKPATEMRLPRADGSVRYMGKLILNKQSGDAKTMLTDEMLITLGNDIRAKAPSMSWNLVNMADEIAQWYSGYPEAAYYVYRTGVGPDEWREAVMNGGGAIQLDGLTASKRDSLLWAIQGYLDPSKANIRAAISDFCSDKATLKASMQSIMYRTARRIEQFYATGTGTTASPALMAYEGGISLSSVDRAIQLTAGS